MVVVSRVCKGWVGLHRIFGRRTRAPRPSRRAFSQRSRVRRDFSNPVAVFGEQGGVKVPCTLNAKPGTPNPKVACTLNPEPETRNAGAVGG